MEILGEGGQGCVYKALRTDRHSGMQQTVAIKILHSKTAVKTWQREFESLARVRSPHCVQVLSFERFRGRPALVLEYVDGISLAQLGQAVWLSAANVREIVAQLECALVDLHRHGLHHGDLSPQNILIDRDGRVRVLDFGLANSSEEESRLTPAFAAPERLCGAPASEASDLYSLGRVQEFLLGSAEGAYLAEDPAQRELQCLRVCREQQDALAEKIRSHLSRRELISGARTQTHAVTSQAAKWPLKAPLLGAIASLMILVTSSASQVKGPARVGHLNIRTRAWHRIEVDGRALGYSPVSLPLTAGTPHHLRWTSARGQGEKILVMKPYERKTLEDSDFSH